VVVDFAVDDRHVEDGYPVRQGGHVDCHGAGKAGINREQTRLEPPIPSLTGFCRRDPLLWQRS